MLKVIDLGFGRTGTMSLKSALETLGFGTCYHFSEMYDHEDHPAIWRAASRGEKVDWDMLFDGYHSSVYCLPCYDYMDILKKYPDAKVILTIRDGESWYKSVHDTIYSYNRLTFVRRMFLLFRGLFNAEHKKLYNLWNLQEETLWKNIFKGRFHDKTYAMDVFLKHIEEVKREVPADRLLVYNIKEGWEPLCHFLSVPVPNETFPKVNDSSSFIEWRRGLFK